MAAEVGDPEAQYYLGEALRKSNRYITIEALHVYEASSLQGDIYSIIRLATADSDLCTAMRKCSKGSKSPDDWMRTAISYAEMRQEREKRYAQQVLR
jgi:uncharacterized protein